MIKKILIGLVVIALIGGALVYFFGAQALNSGVKKGVESFGPKVTQTSVTLDSVALSPFSGNGTLKGLTVGNPEGFKSEHIFKLNQIDVKIDTGSIFSDTIIIDEIHIKEPGISYEKTLTSSNIKELQKNIEEFTGPKAEEEPSAEDPADAGAKKQLVIKKLTIENGTIYVGAFGTGQTVSLPLIEMSNIGGEGSDTNIADVLEVILSKVLTNIGPAIANAGELTKEAANALKTQGLEKVDQAGKAAGDTVNKASEEINEGIKNLFGK